MLQTLILMMESEDERRWFFALFRYYYSYMYHIALQILQDPALAEDAVQDALEAVIRYGDRSLAVGSRKLGNTLRIIQRNKAFDLYQQRKKIRAAEIEEHFGESEEPPVAPNEPEALGSAMLRLKTEYQEILMLRYDSGYSVKEIAGILAISKENAKRRLSRAKAALAEILKEEGILK